MPKRPRASLLGKQAQGGVIGGKGYGFQDAYIVSRIPLWLEDPDFAQFLKEGAGDVDVHFSRAKGEERWYVQVKDYQVNPPKAREVFAQFLETDAGSPGTYTHFFLACPGLSDDLKRLRAAVEELRGAAPFYRPGQDDVLDNTRADLQGLVGELKLPVDAAFLVEKVHFDTDLAGLTSDVSLCDQFVGALLRLKAWGEVPPQAAVRAYEKLALLCHGAIRKTCSREQVEGIIREAAEEMPARTSEPSLQHSVPPPIPFPRNPDFKGREEDLERLHKALVGEAPVGIQSAISVGLTGMGGIGKTQLAVEYAYRYKDAYPGGVLWINAAEPLVQEFARLGRWLQPTTAGRPLDEQVRAVVNYLGEHPNALLILDNLADPTALNRPVTSGVVPAALPCKVLFTTRRRDVGPFQSIQIAVLSEEAALQLLLRHPSRAPILDPAHLEHAEAHRICTVLGYLPLALVLAGAHLGRRPGISLASYRQELERRGALPVLDDSRGRMREEETATRHVAAVAATLAGQWESLESDDARLLLRVAGQMPEAALIPIARLELLLAWTGQEQEGGFFAPLLAPALGELQAASLIEELRGEQVRLHPLVHEFAARQTPEDEVASFRRQCAVNLARAYEDVAVLEDHCARRGVDALQDDLNAALRMLGPPLKAGDETEALLQSLLIPLQRESHNLRGWDRKRNPAFFAQQVHNQAIGAGLPHIVARAATRLEQLGRPYLALRWGISEPAGLVRTLVGHKSKVSAVAVTGDGRYAVSGSADGTLKVWDLQTGEEVRTLAGHEGEVNAVAVTPDGRYAVFGSDDRTLKVWDLQTGQETRTLAGDEYRVNTVAVAPDGRYAVSGSWDGALKVWDISASLDANLQMGEGVSGVVRTLAGHEGRVSAVTVTPDGRYAVSGSFDRTLKVWDLQTGGEVRTLAGHEDDVIAVAVTSDGRYAVSGSIDGTLKVWDLQTGEEVRTLAGHESGVNAMAVTPDGRHAISAGFDDRTLKVWDLQTGGEVCTLAGHEDGVNAVAVTPDGRYAVSGSDDHTLRVWDISASLDAGLRTGEKVRTLAGRYGVVAVAVTPDGRYAVSGSADDALKVWDLQTGEEVHTLARRESGVVVVAVTPDGRYAVSGAWDGTLKVWDLQTGEEVRTLAGHGLGVSDVAVTPDGRRAVSAGFFDRTLKVWDLQTGEEVRTLASYEGWSRAWRYCVNLALRLARKRIALGHAAGVSAAAVTPDGRYVISGSDDDTLKVWDLQTGGEVRTLAGHESRVSAVAVTPDGRYAVSGSFDHTLKVWDLQTGAEVRTLTGHEDRVLAMAVMPDGRYAVSGSDDHTLKVWDLRTGQEVVTAALESTAHCIALAPESTIIIGTPTGAVCCFVLRKGG